MTPCCLAVSRKNALVHVGGANMKDTDVTLFETPDVGDEHGSGNAREEQVSEHQAWGGKIRWLVAGQQAKGREGNVLPTLVPLSAPDANPSPSPCSHCDTMKGGRIREALGIATTGPR